MFRGLSVYTGNAHPRFAEDICHHLEIPLGKAEVFKFKNDEIFVKINEAYRVPHRAFLERAHVRGIRFAVGSDSHFALIPLDRTVEMLREAGIGDGPFLDGRRAQDGVSTATSS